MNKYLFTYSYQGHRYSFELPAETKEEACQRVKAIRDAEYTGEIRDISWLKNMIFGEKEES